MGAMDDAKIMEHLEMKQEEMLNMHVLSNKFLAETDEKENR